MCGIAGFNLSPTDNIDAARLSKALLHQIVARGKDATGAAWTTEDGGTVRLVKRPQPARAFTAHGLTNMAAGTRNAILHTRWATKGSPSQNANNHPIAAGMLVGVHNGHIGNDDDLFANLPAVERAGKVDSEAIFAWLAHSGWDATEALDDLWGRAAVAWIDRTESAVLHLARVEGSPLAVGQTPEGGLVFASTRDLLEKACADADVTLAWVEDVPEMTYMRVRDGVILDYLPVGRQVDVKVA
jgi:glucosamine 6-phosphate synthetase-like amidotransferase/phosphosugar isomerase protein